VNLNLKWPVVLKSALTISVLLIVVATPIVFAGNYDRTYNSQVQFGLVSHELHVSVPTSLYDYYHGKTPKLGSDSDYSKLVTPDAVKPIADNIRNLTLDKPRSDEEFANAVLTLVHQIPYADCDVNYPVETLIENSGKCDTLSLLAASIMKAGGLDVVLLYFKGVHHINVGVYLPEEPHGTWWWLPPTGYDSDGKKYWIAECTPAMEWKVGDVPPILADEQPCIISLENSEKTSPARVSSNLGSPLNASSITINLSSEPENFSFSERRLTLYGSLSPAYPNETVSVYFSQDGIFYNACRTETDYCGNYSFSWNLTSTGTYYVRASWSGNQECTGADSETLTVFIGFPQSLIQFEGPGYYYTYGRADFASNTLRVRQGVEDFLDVQLSGTGVLLTGEFIILSRENSSLKTQTKTVVFSSNSRKIKIPSLNEFRAIPATELRVAVPANVPKGMRLLRLPDDFDFTLNNKFGFILQNDVGNNYSVNVRGMDGSDIEQINLTDGNGTVFFNASTAIRENRWYKVVASMSENETTAVLYDVNGTLLESTSMSLNKTRFNDLVMLIADNKDKTVAFKDLKVETLDGPVKRLPETNEKASNKLELLLLLPNIVFIILLVSILFANVVYKKTRRAPIK